MWEGMDLEIRQRPNKVLPGNFSGGTDKKHEEFVMIVSAPAEI
jgi:hypothetical protein